MSSLPPPAGEPEYLGDAPAGDAPEGRKRTATVVGIAVVAVVATAAVGAWAAASWLATGSQPADALPATAIAYMSVDLDPSADQKLEALRILEKFPALDEKLGLDVPDDLRRWVFDRSGLGTCDGVDYDQDVEPWLGERAALGVLPAKPGASEPEVVVALQVSDEQAASDGLDKLSGCAPARSGLGPEPGTGHGAGPMGHAFADGYVLLAQTQAAAEEAADEAGDRPLGEDDEFRRWTEAAGSPGIAAFYASSDAPRELMKLAASAGSAEQWSTYVPGESPGDPPAEAFEGFEGMAAVVRFEDGAVEAEFAAGGLPGLSTPGDTATGVTDLPASTGAALSFVVPEGWLDGLLESASATTGMSEDQLLAEAEAASGLSLPEDLHRLLGSGLSLVVDSELEAGAAIGGDAPSGLPVGVRIEGDPVEIMPVVDKLKAGLGPAAAMVVVQPADGAVAVGLGEEYVGRLAGQGSLGDDATFRAAVPEAERAGGVVYANFDAGDAWLQRLVEDFARRAEGPPSSVLRDNLEALDALGISAWAEGDVQRGLFRLTTD